MTTNVFKRWALACVLISMVACEASAQEFPIGDLQLFDRRDLSTYGNAPRVNQGYFFEFEGLLWAVSTPNKAAIGNPDLAPVVRDVGLVRRQVNTFDTGDLFTEVVSGQRGEVGFVKGHWGWLLGGFKVNSNTQEFAAGDVDIVFQDVFTPVVNEQFVIVGGVPVLSGVVTVEQVGSLQGFIDQDGDMFDDDIDGDGINGRFDNANMPLDPRNYDLDDLVQLPTNFTEMRYTNRTETWGLELMPFYRSDPTHHNGNFEYGFGVRYLKFKDNFNVDALGGFLVDDGTAMRTTAQTQNMLSESFWHTEADNNIVGPQVSARWFKKKGAWTLSTQGRYFAGFNFQNIIQRGSLGVGDQMGMNPFIGPRPSGFDQSLTQTASTFTNSLHQNEFSNVVELRAQADYQLTKAISVNVGWTGIWMDGIARASNLVEYRLPTLGLLASENRQAFYTHGLNIGVQINR